MLVALRATHEHLDLGVLDALTRGSEHLSHVIEKLNERSGVAHPDGDAEAAGTPIAGWVVVATCNRLEVYLDAHRFHESVDLVAQAVSATSGLEIPQVSLCLETAMGRPVVEHLYEVVAGLRSIVVGEAEISGQVRDAFEADLHAGHTTAMLNDLFQLAFRTAKKVRTTTPVGAAGRSGAAVALDRAADLLGPLQDRRVLVIGTGAYARLGVAELDRRGCRAVRVHSASGRAVSFAERHGVTPVTAAELPQALREADLVLACSGRGTSLFPELFLDVGPTLILDLALHSDLHPLVRHLEDVRVLDLAEIGAGAGDPTGPALLAAHGVVGDGVEQFHSKQEFRRVDPAMAALRSAVTSATDVEVDRLRREHPEQADEVERSIRRILAKVMHSPTARARQLALEGNADEFVEAFHTIFGIDISTGETDPGPDGVPGGWMRLDRTEPSRAVLTPPGCPEDAMAEAPSSPNAAEPAVEPSVGELEAQLAQIAAHARVGTCPLDLMHPDRR